MAPDWAAVNYHHRSDLAAAGDFNCHIGEFGERLVHYRMLKGKPVRIPSTLRNLEALAKHLKAKKAVLVQG